MLVFGTQGACGHSSPWRPLQFAWQVSTANYHIASCESRFNRDFGQSVIFELRRGPSSSLHSFVQSPSRRGGCFSIARKGKKWGSVFKSYERKRENDSFFSIERIRSMVRTNTTRDRYSNSFKRKDMASFTNVGILADREIERIGKEWQILFFLSLSLFLSFPFRREISSASWNVDKSVKVSLNLKSVSNQIRRCNNI